MIRHQAIFDRELPAGYDGVFMWDFLKGAFGPTIEPMDIDAVVERHGRFLLFETKTPGVAVPHGQAITLERILRDARWTVIFCAKRPEDIREWTVVTREHRTRIVGDATALKAWCAAWYDYASSHDPVW